MIKIPYLDTCFIPKVQVRVKAFQSWRYTELRQITILKDNCIYKTRKLAGLFLSAEQKDILIERIEAYPLSLLSFPTITIGSNPDAEYLLYIPEDIEELITVINDWSKEL